MKEFIVSNQFHNKKLHTFLSNTLPNLSNTLFYKTLRKRDIKVNDVRVHENILVKAGDNIKVYIDDAYLENTSQSHKTISSNIINIIYEDEHIMVINKPAGIEVTGKSSFTTLLQNSKKENTPTPVPNKNTAQQKTNIFVEPCHRLDRNTTGLILFAKDKTSLDILLAKFKNREIEKHYLAKVYGIPKEQEKILEAYLFKDKKKARVYISDIPKKGYVKILTKYTIVQTNKNENTSILDVQLLTGKTHQIRAHLAHIGYPLIGDGKYGRNEINKKFGVKIQQLCSYKLKFNFTTDASILNYLNQKEIILKQTP